jgi:hypothetical protein
VAFGEGQCETPVTLDFPIMEHGLPVEGLTGHLTRSNREFYVCVKATAVRDKATFMDREVSISLINRHNSQRKLQRTVDVGVTIFLGAGLPLTDESEVEAELLPVGDPDWQN